MIIYRVTKKFPREEMFGIVMQMRRAAVSVCSNIAEGFSRNSPKEKIQFYYVALGSLTEVRNQADLARGVGYLLETDYLAVETLAVGVDKLIHGLIRSCKNFIPYTLYFLLK